MATIAATSTRAFERTEAARAPWYIWCAILAVTSAIVGGHWDISWHSSIGRDTFWTPAHMAIYLCGVLAGISFGYIILTTTFSPHAPLRGASVTIWGFRAPLGAFIASWGGIAMLTSAPFDNWWHAAYGLDVKILSPPHLVLFIGMYGVLIGTLALIAGHINRVTGADQRLAKRLFLYVAGVTLVAAMVLILEYTGRPQLHSALPYILICALSPIILTVASRTTGMRFAATFVAGFYMLYNAGLILVLPLFPAEPKLGPVYQPVTHFIPQQFPILLVPAALALDLLWQRAGEWNKWALAFFSAAAFVLVLVAAEWPFATFLMSPASRNAFFGTAYLAYGIPSTTYLARNLFYDPESGWRLARGLLIAIVISTMTIRFGIARGEWMRSIKR